MTNKLSCNEIKFIGMSDIEFGEDGHRMDSDPLKYHLWIRRKKGLTKQQAIWLKEQIVIRFNNYIQTKRGKNNG